MATATMPPPATQLLMTVEEFWDFCQLAENQGQSYELIRGKVVPKCRPTHPHGFACGNIARYVGNYSFETHDGYVTTNDSGVVLCEDPATVVGPDVAFYRGVRTREDVPKKWGDKVPVLAVEVLSPTDRFSRVQNKIDDYLESGVALVWLADPEEMSMMVYRPGKRGILFPANSILSGGEELPGFSVRVGDLFRYAFEDRPVGA